MTMRRHKTQKFGLESWCSALQVFQEAEFKHRWNRERTKEGGN